VSVVDQDGNAASATTTLNTNYGCKVWVPGGGYFLNSEMDDFSALPGMPNFYGLIGGEANAIAPGKRMLSSMSPTIVERNGSLLMILGTPGGSTIMTSVVQVSINVAAYGMTIDEAVQATRFHHQWYPDEIMMEPDAFSPTLSKQLEEMGHTFRSVDYIGAIEAIMVDHEGHLHGAADRRTDDHAAGW
jgi:gamma-glutamyltranspeptidase/glutathione hydrolase